MRRANTGDYCLLLGQEEVKRRPWWHNPHPDGITMRWPCSWEKQLASPSTGFSAVPGPDDPTVSFFVLDVVRIECHKEQQVLRSQWPRALYMSDTWHILIQTFKQFHICPSVAASASWIEALWNYPWCLSFKFWDTWGRADPRLARGRSLYCYHTQIPECSAVDGEEVNSLPQTHSSSSRHFQT